MRAQGLVEHAVDDAARTLLVTGLVADRLDAGHDIGRPARVMKVPNSLPDLVGRRDDFDFLERASHEPLPLACPEYKTTRHLLGWRLAHSGISL